MEIPSRLEDVSDGELLRFIAQHRDEIVRELIRGLRDAAGSEEEAFAEVHVLREKLRAQFLEEASDDPTVAIVAMQFVVDALILSMMRLGQVIDKEVGNA
jgi:hypothetical protein